MVMMVASTCLVMLRSFVFVCSRFPCAVATTVCVVLRLSIHLSTLKAPVDLVASFPVVSWLVEGIYRRPGCLQLPVDDDDDDYVAGDDDDDDCGPGDDDDCAAGDADDEWTNVLLLFRL